MTENYISTLKGSDLDRYVKKLQCLCGRVGESNMLTLKTLDPYQFPSTEWIDDVLLWPPVDFPSLYTYFIDAPGGYTREKLKAYKSLEAYNYYQRFVALNCVQWYIHFDLSAVVGSKLSFITVLALMTHIAF